MLSIQTHRAVSRLYRSWLALSVSSILGVASAQDLRCTTEQDTFVGNAQSKFMMTQRMGRGVCIRSRGDDLRCYQTLLAVLANLNELREAEYTGAAGVLALLPTIGALLGTLTNEIWTLLTMLPFGGVLAMALSFGGAIMPVRIEDYEYAMKKRDITIGSIISFRSTDDVAAARALLEKKLKLLEEKISHRLANDDPDKPGQWYLLVDLSGMAFLGSQAAMVVLEQGGVIPWWCTSRWWMHLWYFMVTLTVITENLVQLPFLKQHKLYLSRIAYEVSLSGGDPSSTIVNETR